MRKASRKRNFPSAYFYFQKGSLNFSYCYVLETLVPGEAEAGQNIRRDFLTIRYTVRKVLADFTACDE